MKVLIVDDDEKVLTSLRRILGDDFDIEVATGGEVALRKLDADDQFAVVVSDLSMPGMDGITFLKRVSELYPAISRIMLTGHSEIDKAIEAIEKGRVLRFLMKPCNSEVLSAALKAGMKQYRLINAEKDIFDRTILGSVDILTEIISLADPIGFSDIPRIKTLTSQICAVMGQQCTAEIKIAASVCLIGAVTFPHSILTRLRLGTAEPGSSDKVLASIADASSRLIRKVPRLEPVADIIKYHFKNYDGSGLPDEPIKGEAIPFGSRVLRVATVYTLNESQGVSRHANLNEILAGSGKLFDPKVVKSLPVIVKPVVTEKEHQEVKLQLKFNELEQGHVLDEDIATSEGLVLVTKGTVVSETVLRLLQNTAMFSKLKEPIAVLPEKAAMN